MNKIISFFRRRERRERDFETKKYERKEEDEMEGRSDEDIEKVIGELWKKRDGGDDVYTLTDEETRAIHHVILTIHSDKHKHSSDAVTHSFF